MSEIKSDELYKQFLTFVLDNELYGIKVENIREVFEYSAMTRVPKVPNYISGIINIRGEIIPVIDLNVLFFEKTNKITKFTCTVVVELNQDGNDYVIGVMIDAVNSVVDIPVDNIESKPDFGAHIKHDFIESIGKVNDNFIILLNMNKVLNIEELSNFNKSDNSSLPSMSISE